MEKKEKRQLPRIDVKTKPNGYSLEFDGQRQTGYFYHTPEKLLEGFMCHIGLHMTEYLDTETMQDFIVAAITWKDNKECVEEIDRLRDRLRIMTAKRNGIAKRLVAERNKHIALFEQLKALAIDFKDVPDLKKRVQDATKYYSKMFPITLDQLTTTKDDVIEDDDEETEEEDDV